MIKKFKAITAIACLSIGLLIQFPNANAVGSGVCTSTTSTSPGVVVANSGGFCYIAFTAVGGNAWTPPNGISAVDFLLIAGGGAGGAGAWGGGGGAGEVVSYTNYSVTPGTALNINVGDGGTTGGSSLTATANRSNPGNNSWVGSSSGVVAQGGGAGASYAYDSGVPAYGTGGTGGSGGGGTEYPSTQNGGTKTASSSGSRIGYGNNGGKGGPGGSTQSGGGGGGASGVGTDAGTSNGGSGGNGTNIFSAWLNAINSGMPSAWQSAVSAGYIAGGGGGGTTTTAGSAGAGGAGRGGSNSTFYPGEAAVANTGSGGGGASYGGSPRAGGAGGSGLLIIKYSAITTTVNSFNLTGNVTNANYRTPVTINVDVNNQSKVTFKANKVIITGCKNKLATGSATSFTATCSWKPSQRGSINLTAEISSVGPWGNTTTSPLLIRVANRASSR